MTPTDSPAPAVKTVKPVKGWAIVNSRGSIIDSGLHRLALLNAWGDLSPFICDEVCLPKNYHCIRVLITPQ